MREGTSKCFDFNLSHLWSLNDHGEPERRSPLLLAPILLICFHISSMLIENPSACFIISDNAQALNYRKLSVSFLFVHMLYLNFHVLIHTVGMNEQWKYLERLLAPTRVFNLFCCGRTERGKIDFIGFIGDSVFWLIKLILCIGDDDWDNKFFTGILEARGAFCLCMFDPVLLWLLC